MYEEEEVKVEETGAEESAPTEYVDKVIVCVDCKKEFTFTAGEQAFYAEKGYQNEPKRCKACRDAKKNRGSSEPKQYYYATCSECGGEARLTFQPSPEKPVYCDACFEKRRRAR